MKKIALVLAVLLFALPMMAFAEVAVTGSVSFELGNTDENDDELAVFTGAKSATATVSVATDDEKVVATVGLNLLPAVTSTYNYAEDYTYDLPYTYDLAGTNFETYVDDYADYLQVSALIDFWNAYDYTETYVSTNATADYAFGTETEIEAIRDGLLAALNGASTLVDVAYYDADDEAIYIKGAEEFGAAAADVTAGEEFVWTDLIGADMAGIYTAGNTYLQPEVDDAVAALMDDADSALINAIDNESELVTFINGLTGETYKALTGPDAEILGLGVDLVVAYDEVKTPSDGDPTVTTALTYITSATLAFKDVFGVLDITANLAGTHASAGNISADENGHDSSTVSGYPSLMVGLSSGVVEGVEAGLTFYIDDSDAGDDDSEGWFTWEYDVDENEVKYGLGANAGYTMTTDDFSAGAAVEFALYDFIDVDEGDTPAMAWAVSVAPMFSGYDANVGIQFDYGMDIMYVMGMVDYTIMGITPSVGFHYLANSGSDYVLSYSSSPSSVMADFKDSDGMLLEAGLAVDLSELIGMGVSVNGGMDYGITSTELAWNAGLAVAGLVDGLTVGFDCDADTVEGSTFDWMASASYAYSIATLSFGIGSDYSTADECNYTSWSLGTSVSF